MKRNMKKENKQEFVILWSYLDSSEELLAGTLRITAYSKADARARFYKNNRKLVVSRTKGSLKLNPKGGYVCDAVLTLREWDKEGRPDYK